MTNKPELQFYLGWSRRLVDQDQPLQELATAVCENLSVSPSLHPLHSNHWKSKHHSVSKYGTREHVENYQMKQQGLFQI